MLSYRHGYHAGNFADVFKHVVLSVLLQALGRKDKPFVYIDTHAGAGRYDLHSEMARKNREFESGIARLAGLEQPPPAVCAYLAAVHAVNSASLPSANAGTAGFRWYPGSPLVARHFLRRGDRVLLAEMHTTDAPQLVREFSGDPGAQVVCGDGYHLLKSHLPPHERRGLVLIDPSYERRDEIRHLIEALQEGYRRWATGVYAIWYPIMPKIPVRTLHRQILDSGLRKVLLAELCIYPEDSPLGMNGAGMILVNPPYQIEAELGESLPWLWHALAHDGQGRYRIDWLVPE